MARTSLFALAAAVAGVAASVAPAPAGVTGMKEAAAALRQLQTAQTAPARDTSRGCTYLQYPWYGTDPLTGTPNCFQYSCRGYLGSTWPVSQSACTCMSDNDCWNAWASDSAGSYTHTPICSGEGYKQRGTCVAGAAVPALAYPVTQVVSTGCTQQLPCRSAGSGSTYVCNPSSCGTTTCSSVLNGCPCSGDSDCTNTWTSALYTPYCNSAGYCASATPAPSASSSLSRTPSATATYEPPSVSRTVSATPPPASPSNSPRGTPQIGQAAGSGSYALTSVTGDKCLNLGGAKGGNGCLSGYRSGSYVRYAGCDGAARTLTYGLYSTSDCSGGASNVVTLSLDNCYSSASDGFYVQAGVVACSSSTAFDYWLRYGQPQATGGGSSGGTGGTGGTGTGGGTGGGSGGLGQTTDPCAPNFVGSGYCYQSSSNTGSPALSTGALAGIVTAAIVLVIVVPLVIAVACCGGIAAAFAGCCCCRSQASPLSTQKTTTTVIMAGQPAMAQQAAGSQGGYNTNPVVLAQQPQPQPQAHMQASVAYGASPVMSAQPPQMMVLPAAVPATSGDAW